MWFLIVLLVIILIIAVKSIKVVRQSEVYIIERLGKFHKVADAGLTIIIPFVDRVRSVVSLKQQTMDVPPQGVITKDNVTITIDTVVFYKVTDPAKAVYEIQSLKKGIEYLAITTIRDIVGKMDLDSTFSSRDMINEELRAILDEATDQWGCKIDRVEIKDITPPADIRDAMEKQMNAERNKRAQILQAEGERQSAITLAQGKKEGKTDRKQFGQEQMQKMQCNQLINALALDDAETAKFKPVYTKYMEEMRAVRDMNPRAPRSTLTDAEVEQVIKARFAQSRKMLDIREKYYNEFRKFLSPKQIQKMYNMEKRIGDKMRKEMGKRQGMKKNNSNSRR